MYAAVRVDLYPDVGYYFRPPWKRGLLFDK